MRRSAYLCIFFCQWKDLLGFMGQGGAKAPSRHSQLCHETDGNDPKKPANAPANGPDELTLECRNVPIQYNY